MINRWRIVRNTRTGEVVVERARWCQGLWCHFRGLMLRRHLPDNEGLLFVYRRASIVDTSIHMFFVFFPIAAVWLDGEGRVVDAKLARPWRPFYAPRKPACYIIEAPPALLDRVQIGDTLTFNEPVT